MPAHERAGRGDRRDRELHRLACCAEGGLTLPADHLAAEEAAFFGLAPCGLALLDADYRIVHANPYFLQMTGLVEADLAEGLVFYRLLSAAGRIFLQTRLQQELALAGRVEELVLDLVRTDGVRVPVMLNAVQCADAEGRPGAIRLAIWRAAAKRAYEAEVPKAREAAAVATRVKADFLANVSHELRTPLNGVVAVAELLGRAELPGDQRSLVETIGASAAALDRILGDILDIARVQAGELVVESRPFDLLEEVSGVVTVARLRAAEKGLGFDFLAAPDVGGRYEGDAVRVKQILSHLASNAVKFTAAGEVRVELACDGEGALVITVADTGVGFDEATAATLFEPFQQAESGATRKHGGLGLGLALCKAAAEAMGGAISARAEPGRGAEFTAVLPLARLDPPQAEEPAEAEDAGALRILLVEDNPTNQEVVRLILSTCEVTLAVADNGRIGVDTWAKDRFDVVLMDLQMPVMDGLSAIREIRRREAELGLARTPIAVLSANAMDHHKRESISVGADLHLSKPITASALIEGIAQALALAA